MKTVSFSIRLDEETKRRLVSLAAAEYRTPGTYIRWLINREWQREMQIQPTEIKPESITE